MLFATLWGLLIFGERPDGWTVTGALLILAGSLRVATERIETPDEPAERTS